MATFPALQDVTWDSGTSAAIYFGALKVGLTKLSPGKMEVKSEKVRRIGESLARKRTPGAAELGPFGGECLDTDFESQILPRMPLHGGTLVEFNILIRLAHPSVSGSHAIWFPETRVVIFDGPELDGSGAEKGLIMKLGFDAMGRFDKGRDGRWKCLHYDPRRSAADAIAAIPF